MPFMFSNMNYGTCLNTQYRIGKNAWFQFFHHQNTNVATPWSSGCRNLGIWFGGTIPPVYEEPLPRNWGKRSFRWGLVQSRDRGLYLFLLPALVP